jgi:hypothetical protein
MPFRNIARRILHLAAAISVLLTLWSHLPPEWRSEAVHRVSHLTLTALRDAAASLLRTLARLVGS